MSVSGFEGSEGFSDVSDEVEVPGDKILADSATGASSFHGSSRAPSFVDVGEHMQETQFEESDSLYITADLSNHLKSKLAAHRESLRAEIRGLKDEGGQQLYSDAEIGQQFTEIRTTDDDEGDRGDSAFGHHATVGHFSVPYRRTRGEETPKVFDFWTEQISVSTVPEWLAEVQYSRVPKRLRDDLNSGIVWVHLPVNNLALVEVGACQSFKWEIIGMLTNYNQKTMLALCNEKYQDMALSKAVRDRSLRRERVAARRACGSKMLAMGQPLRNTCRKAQVSNHNNEEEHHLTLMVSQVSCTNNMSTPKPKEIGTLEIIPY